VDLMGEIEAHGEVRSLNCIRCFKCIDECPTGAIAFSLRRQEAKLAGDAAARAGQSSLRRRKLDAFDVVIAVLWIGATVALTFSIARQGAPQEIKALMTPGLLLVVYGLVWLGRKVWSRRRTVGQTIR